MLDSGTKENASLDIVEDKFGSLLRFSVYKLQPRAIDDQGHASSEQQLKSLQWPFESIADTGVTVVNNVKNNLISWIRLPKLKILLILLSIKI